MDHVSSLVFLEAKSTGNETITSVLLKFKCNSGIGGRKKHFDEINFSSISQYEENIEPAAVGCPSMTIRSPTGQVYVYLWPVTDSHER